MNLLRVSGGVVLAVMLQPGCAAEGVPGGGKGGGADSGESGTTAGTDTAGADDPPDPECSVPVVLEAPGPARLVGPLGTVRLAADAAVQVVALGALGVDGTLRSEPVDGEVVFDDLSTSATGLLELEFARADCAEGAPLSFVVGTEEAYEPVFLETGRQGVDYADTLVADAVHGLPAGLTLGSGAVFGVPEGAAAHVFEAARLDGDRVVRLRVHLAVLDGTERLPEALPEAPGPWSVVAEERTIPSIEISRGVVENVAMWVTRPDGSGPFPLVAFHHAAHYPADIYDFYTSLHEHWASHGFVVASVDSRVNVSGMAQSWQNLADMSTFQLAAADAMVAASADPASALYGHIDPDRVFVSGHSRGGGASLLSLWARPDLMGAICFEQVSPLQTPGQDWADPEANGDRPLPKRPVLLFSAANDLDEPWPLVDTAFDQITGPATLVTLHGTNHEYTYDDDTPGSLTSSSDISYAERHALDQRWSTAFLLRHARAEVGWDALLYGPEGLSSDLSEPGVSTHGRWRLHTELLVDDFAADAGENLMGGANDGVALDTNANEAPYTAGLVAAGRGGAQADAISGWTTARHLAWSEPGATLSLDLVEAIDLTEQRWLVFRVARDCPPPRASCATGRVDFDVVLTDNDGARASLAVSEGVGDKGIVGRHWTSAILPLDDFGGVDLSQVVSVELDLAALGVDAGDLWLDDLRFE